MANGNGMTPNHGGTGDTAGLAKTLLAWAMNQGPSTVMLGAILVSIYFLTNYAITTAVPAHLKTIQEGYKDIATEHREALKDMGASQERSYKHVTESFDREAQWLRDRERERRISAKGEP